MRKLKITGCSDGQMWYAGLVGQVVPLLREESDCYLSREPAGYTNVVRKGDGKPVWISPSGLEYADGDAVDCACRQSVLILSRGVSQCKPIGPVPFGSSHSVARCTFEQEAISTNVPMTKNAEAAISPLGPLGRLMETVTSGLARAEALLSKGTKEQ